ncbi:MAG: ammonium transporter [Rhodospirillales bacterium]
MDETRIDIVWVLTASALVFMMQAGFCCLESGSVRSKNSINVAAKNFADFCISAGVFWMVGFGIMFGASASGLYGSENFMFSVTDPQSAAFFVFQLMFCGTATTIVSGAIAERARYTGYLLISLVVALPIYPVFGHWAWGGAFGGDPGWLAALGFVDFAGGTVVHSVAGWVSLAAVMIIGPRTGRFSNGSGAPFRSHSLPLAALGVFIIWVGWIGFNGGSTLAASDQVPLIVLNTVMAGAFGGLGVMVLGPLTMKRMDVPSMLNGALAGLVAITPAAHCVSTAGAVTIGAVGGGLCILASLLMDRLKLDDVVYAFPVHGVAGVWGTMAVALLGDLDLIGTGLGRWEQFMAQGTGVLTAAVWAFTISYVLLRLINRFVPLRVSPEAERIGLNVSEHNQSTEQLDILRSMEVQRLTGDYSKPIPVEPSSDIGDIARQYNLVLENLYSAKMEAEQASKTKSNFLASMSHELRTPLNAIIGFSEMITRQYFGPLGSDKYHEYAGDIMQSSKHLLSLVDDILDLSKIEAGRNPLNRSPIDIQAMFDDCLRIVTGATDCSQIYFDIKVAKDTSQLLADERGVKQVVLNLLFNAVKFTPSGGLVTLAAREEPGRHVLEVIDTGNGIPDEKLESVIEPFQQLHSDPHIAQMGTGLGLSIAKALAQAHGGELQIDSRIGRGTTVRVILPIVAELVGK